MAFLGLRRVEGPVALQPDEAAHRTACQQHEAHDADGVELLLPDPKIFFNNRHPLLHFCLYSGSFLRLG